MRTFATLALAITDLLVIKHRACGGRLKPRSRSLSRVQLESHDLNGPPEPASRLFLFRQGRCWGC
jgi:hypothetical protein